MQVLNTASSYISRLATVSELPHRIACAHLGDQAEVGRVGPPVGEARGLLVGVRLGQVVGRLAGAAEHLALVVGPVLHLHLLRERLHLVLRVRHANQVAVRNLEATSGRLSVVDFVFRWRQQRLCFFLLCNSYRNVWYQGRKSGTMPTKDP